LDPQCVSEGISLQLTRIGSGWVVSSTVIQIWVQHLPTLQRPVPLLLHVPELLPTDHTCPPFLADDQLEEGQRRSKPRCLQIRLERGHRATMQKPSHQNSMSLSLN